MKKKNGTKKIFFVFFLCLVVMLGSGLGYFIQKNGGGVQGTLVTMSGKNIEEIQELDTINILLLRDK